MTVNTHEGRADVTDRLRKRFPTVAEDRLTEVVDDGYRDLAGARIESFVDVLVEKHARDVLEH